MPSGNVRQIVSRSPGYTLPMMLIVLAVLSYGAMAASLSSRYRMAREQEAELIFRGLAYVNAIKSFYLAEKEPTKRRLPRNLKELESDPRFAAHHRYIRKLYLDPLTGGKFRLLIDSDGGVKGVASKSKGKLFRRTRISSAIPFTGGAKRYNQLLFEIDPKILEQETEGTIVGPGPTPHENGAVVVGPQ
jgi:type II secretory pathway pseudopilin PulG